MKKIFKTSLPVLTLCFLVSCGDNAGSGGGLSQGEIETQNESIMPDGSNIKGIYAADLAPVNYNLHFMKIGAAAVARDGDNFSAYVRLKYGPKDTTLKQAIYTGRRCPTIKDDLNKDAYIDFKEALAAIGQITIPLDSNLDSQEAGRFDYPRADAVTGKMYYNVTASFDRLFADLKTPDANPSDNIIKLSANDGITFPGRIVLLQGMTKKVKLPPTVSGAVGEDAYESMPVACGVLWKVKELPAELKPE